MLVVLQTEILAAQFILNHTIAEELILLPLNVPGRRVESPRTGHDSITRVVGLHRVLNNMVLPR